MVVGTFSKPTHYLFVIAASCCAFIFSFGNLFAILVYYVMVQLAVTTQTSSSVQNRCRICLPDGPLSELNDISLPMSSSLGVSSLLQLLVAIFWPTLSILLYYISGVILLPVNVRDALCISN